MKAARKHQIEKIVFFVISMLILFFLISWALEARNSDSPYIRFQDNIDTFK